MICMENDSIVLFRPAVPSRHGISSPPSPCFCMEIGVTRGDTSLLVAGGAHPAPCRRAAAAASAAAAAAASAPAAAAAADR